MGRTYRQKDKKFKQRLKENRKTRQTKRRIEQDEHFEVRGKTDENLRNNHRPDELEGEENWNENF